MVERSTDNRKVEGSTPFRPILFVSLDLSLLTYYNKTIEIRHRANIVFSLNINYSQWIGAYPPCSISWIKIVNDLFTQTNDTS